MLTKSSSIERIAQFGLMPNPLIGKHIPEFGPRFPDMSEAYQKEMTNLALKIAAEQKLTLHCGCYIGVTGPSYETPSEYQYFRQIGGDAVGMSTTPEVIAAKQMGIQCFGVSVVTDLGIPGKIEYLTHQQVIEAAKNAGPKLALLLKELINRIV